MIKLNKLPVKVSDLLTERLKDEYAAFYFYRGASNWCNSIGFLKAGEYFAKESEDELTHAQKIEKYLVDWNVIPSLPSIAEPATNFSGLLDVIEQSYNIEYNLYESYEDTSLKIFSIGDLCVFDFLKFYRTTQKESVSQYSTMLNILEGVDTKSKFELLAIEKKLF